VNFLKVLKYFLELNELIKNHSGIFVNKTGAGGKHGIQKFEQQNGSNQALSSFSSQQFPEFAKFDEHKISTKMDMHITDGIV
jgi:tripartite-type tricarboxylate transporter receptor subunit TctC